MIRRLVAWALVGVLVTPCAARAADAALEPGTPWALGCELLAPAPASVALDGATPLPELVLLQRAIERSWGLSEDSTYVELSVPDWRSEGLAMGLSGVVPGAGQWYSGEGSALWFALAEAAGWTARTLWLRRSDDLDDQALGYAGVPVDSASVWSFERWSDATGQDPQSLETLYAADREAFFETIAHDDQYLAGWSGNAQESRGLFRSLRDRADDHDTRARWASAGLWFNHVVSAVDALRAARLHNLPLRRNLELKLESAWHRGQPGLIAVLQRRF